MKRSISENPGSALARLASIVRNCRSEASTSQEALAALCGISTVRLSKIERNLANDVRLSTVAKLAKGLQIDVCDIVGGGAASVRTNPAQDVAGRVALNVAGLRKDLGLTQEELSEAAGQFRAYVGRLERLRVDPSISALERIAGRLGVPVAILLRPNSGRRAGRKRTHDRTDTGTHKAEKATDRQEAAVEVELIASMIQFRRRELGLTQRAAAKKCHLSHSAFVHLEQRAAPNPRLSTLMNIADGFELEILDLVEKADEPREASPQDPGFRLAANVFRLRKAAKISQADLSLNSGHAERFVNHIEQLRADPPLSSLKRIASELGVRLPDLLRPVSNRSYRAIADKYVSKKLTAKPDKKPL